MGSTRIPELIQENTEAWREYGKALRHVQLSLDPSTYRNDLENGTLRLYDIVSENLSSANTNKRIEIQGDYLHAHSSATLDGIGVKLNSPTAPLIYFSQVNPLKIPFHILYLTNPAQAGKTLKLLVGRSNLMKAYSSPKIVEFISKFHFIGTDKDSHFTGSITQNAKENENVYGLPSDNVIIDSVRIQSDQNLWYKVVFWQTNDFDDTDLDSDAFCGEVDFDLPNDGFQIGGANQYYMQRDGLDIQYMDIDQTRKLHLSVLNLSATSKNAGATGEVVVEVICRECADTVNSSNTTSTKTATITVTSDDPDTATTTFTVTGSY